MSDVILYINEDGHIAKRLKAIEMSNYAIAEALNNIANSIYLKNKITEETTNGK